MSRVRNRLRRIPLFVLALIAGLVAVAVVAVVVFAGGDEKKKHLIDPDPEDHGFHVNGVAEKYAGAAPMKIKLAAEAYHAQGDVKWLWRFDDGAISDEKIPTHTFKEPGYYQVLVDGYDEKGQAGRMNVLIGVWPRKLWENAQAGKPYNRNAEIARQWERSAKRKKEIVRNCLRNPICRKHELADRKARRAEIRREKIACRKSPQCVRDTRRALREGRQARRAAKKAGVPNIHF
jgi:PKD domain-containing protein